MPAYVLKYPTRKVNQAQEAAVISQLLMYPVTHRD